MMWLLMMREVILPRFANDLTFPAERNLTITFFGEKVSSCGKGTRLERQTYVHLVTRVSENKISLEILENLDQASVLRSDRYCWCQMNLSHMLKAFHPYTVSYS